MTFVNPELLPATLAMNSDEPFGDEELDALLAEQWAANAELAEDAPRPWSVDSLESAEWAMRKLAVAADQISALSAQRDEWIGKIEQWHREVTAPIAGRYAFFEGRLKMWAIDRRDVDGIVTSKLPSGVVATRRAKNPSPYIVDESLLIAWLDEHPEQSDALKITKKALISKLNVDCAQVVNPETGELVGWFAFDNSAPSDAEPNVELVPGVGVKLPTTEATVTPAL